MADQYLQVVEAAQIAIYPVFPLSVLFPFAFLSRKEHAST